MNISLEEQIEYMRERALIELDCVLLGVNPCEYNLCKAILATLESCREQKIVMMDESGKIIGYVKEQNPSAGEWLAPTKPDTGP
jgi:hypothetical protein